MNPCARYFLTGWISLLAFVPAFSHAEKTANVVVAPHAKELVALQGEKLVSFKSDNFLQAPFTILYFGAGWCPDCRRFSPALVAAYDRQSPTDRRFEVIFISKDKSEESMLKFMRSEQMKWPALAFNKITSATNLTRLYSGHGIP